MRKTVLFAAAGVGLMIALASHDAGVCSDGRNAGGASHVLRVRVYRRGPLRPQIFLSINTLPFHLVRRRPI